MRALYSPCMQVFPYSERGLRAAPNIIELCHLKNSLFFFFFRATLLTPCLFLLTFKTDSLGLGLNWGNILNSTDRWPFTGSWKWKMLCFGFEVAPGTMQDIQPLAESCQTAAGYYRSRRIFCVSAEICAHDSSCGSHYASGERGSHEWGPGKR